MERKREEFPTALDPNEPNSEKMNRSVTKLNRIAKHIEIVQQLRISHVTESIERINSLNGKVIPYLI